MTQRAMIPHAIEQIRGDCKDFPNDANFVMPSEHMRFPYQLDWLKTVGSPHPLTPVSHGPVPVVAWPRN